MKSFDKHTGISTDILNGFRGKRVSRTLRTIKHFSLYSEIWYMRRK